MTRHEVNIIIWKTILGNYDDLSDNHVDFSENYVNLSDNHVDFSKNYVILSDHYVGLPDIRIDK